MGIHAALIASHGHQVTVLSGREGSVKSAPTVCLRELDSKAPEILALNERLDRGELPEGFEPIVSRIESRLAETFATFDACIIHNALTLHFNLPLTAALHRLAGRLQTRLIAWCHDLSWANRLYLGQMHSGYPWQLLKTAAPNTKYVVVSDDRRQDFSRLAGLPPETIAVIPAGVDPSSAWKLRPSTQRLLRQLGLLEADPFILLPARITRRKNIELAIAVVSALLHHGLNPRLVVTGPPGPHNIRSGEYVDELRAQRSALGVEREVLFLFEQRWPTGRTINVTDAMMEDLYLAADLLLFPSSQEGFGIPILEAGIVRLPVFAADIPALRETAGSDARFFALSETPERIADDIAAFVASDPAYRLKKSVLQRYDWEHVYARHIAPLLSAASATN